MQLAPQPLDADAPKDPRGPGITNSSDESFFSISSEQSPGNASLPSE